MAGLCMEIRLNENATSPYFSVVGGALCLTMHPTQDLDDALRMLKGDLLVTVSSYLNWLWRAEDCERTFDAHAEGIRIFVSQSSR